MLPFTLPNFVLFPGLSAVGGTFVLVLLWGHMDTCGNLCGALS